MADALDILTPIEAVQAIFGEQVTSTDRDAELAQHLTMVSRRMDAKVGPVVKRGATVTLDGRDANRLGLRLPLTPVYAVAAVEVWDGSNEPTPLTAAAYGTPGGDWRLDETGAPHFVYLIRLSGSSPVAWETLGVPNIQVTYEAGRFEDTASVDARFKDCAGAILRRLWHRERSVYGANPSTYGAGDDGGGGQFAGFYGVIDAQIKEQLGDQLLPPSIA